MNLFVEIENNDAEKGYYMSKIKVTVSNFAGKYSKLNRKSELEISRIHLIHYVMSTGMPLFKSWDMSSSIKAKVLAFYKALAICYALDFNDIYLKKNPSYLSVWIGVAGTAMVADLVLGVSRLYHASEFKKYGLIKLSNPGTCRLADFVGDDKDNDWHVFESKARQTSVSDEERDKWKSQAQTIGTVHFLRPKTASYCFTRIHDRFCSIDLVDPPLNERDTNDFDDQDKFSSILRYYQTLLDILEGSNLNVQFNGDYIRFTLAGFDPVTENYIYIGLHESVYNMIRNHQIPRNVESCGGPTLTEDEDFLEKFSLRNRDDFSKNKFFLASNGIAVAISKHPDEIEL
jgi:hypothetical protein